MGKSNDRATWRERITAYAPLIIWIGVIFYLSSSRGAMSETSRFIRPILEFLFPNATEATLLVYHGYIRKFAHFAEYAVLALFASRAFCFFSGSKVRKYWYLFALGLAATIAALDEYNQSLDQRRMGSGWDVLLDMTGALTAIAIFWLYARWRQEPQMKRRETYAPKL